MSKEIAEKVQNSEPVTTGEHFKLAENYLELEAGKNLAFDIAKLVCPDSDGNWSQEKANRRYIAFMVAEEALRHSQEKMQELEAEKQQLIAAIDSVLYGTLLDKHGTRDDDGMLSYWNSTENFKKWTKVLLSVRKIVN